MVMEPHMEQPTFIDHSQRLDEPEFDLKEWSRRVRLENTRRRNSRRYSASFIGTFREDEAAAKKSLRPNLTISSATSSPGYTIGGLKAKNMCSWEKMSPEGKLALNSKWSEAERYICNPLSGEVPLECLSAKTLSGKSFHQFSSRVAISKPIVHPLQPRHLQRKPSVAIYQDGLKIPVQEGKSDNMKTDVGIESPPPVMDSWNPSPVTPSIEERAIKRSGSESEESLQSIENREFDGEVEIKENNEEEQGRERNEGENYQNGSKKMTCSSRRGGCFISWSTLWKKRNHENDILQTRKKNMFLCHKIGCLKE